MSLYTLPALANVSLFDLGRGMYTLAHADQLPLAAELLAARPQRAVLYGHCPVCFLRVTADEAFIACVACPWRTRNWSFELLWGLAYAGLTMTAPSALDESVHSHFQRRFSGLFDLLSPPVFRHVQTLYWLSYVLLHEPVTRRAALPVCTCGHPAAQHVGIDDAGRLRPAFYAVPVCLEPGCACPYYAMQGAP